MADLVDTCMKDNVICVFGGQEKIEANKDVFGAVKAGIINAEGSRKCVIRALTFLVCHVIISRKECQL
jgi:hypothetical protein